MYILLMSVLRRSFLSFGYVAFILPNLKSGAQVLRQNIFAQDKEGIDLQRRIEEGTALEARIEPEF